MEVLQNFEQFKENYAKLKIDNLENTQAISNLNRALADLEATSSKLHESLQHQSPSDGKHELGEIIEKIAMLDKNLEQFQNTEGALQEELSELKEDLDSLARNTEVFNEQDIMVKASIAALDTKTDLLVSLNEMLRKDQENQREDIASLERQFSLSEKEIQNHEEEIDQLHSDLSSWVGNMKILTSGLTEVSESTSTKYEMLQEQFVSMEEGLEKLEGLTKLIAAQNQGVCKAVSEITGIQIEGPLSKTSERVKFLNELLKIEGPTCLSANNINMDNLVAINEPHFQSGELKELEQHVTRLTAELNQFIMETKLSLANLN